MSKSFTLFEYAQLMQPIMQLPTTTIMIEPFSITYRTGKPDDYVSIQYPDDDTRESASLNHMFPHINSVAELRVDLLVDRAFTLEKKLGRNRINAAACYYDEVTINEPLAYFDWLLSLKDLAIIQHQLLNDKKIVNGCSQSIKELEKTISMLENEEKERRSQYFKMKRIHQHMEASAKQSAAASVMPAISVSNNTVPDVKNIPDMKPSLFLSSSGTAADVKSSIVPKKSKANRVEVFFRVMCALYPSAKPAEIEKQLKCYSTLPPPGGTSLG